MIVSARNNLKGKVKKLAPGAVNTEVTVELAGGAEVVSIITKESAELEAGSWQTGLRRDQGQ
jgi:molybdopterin-binding protein